MSFGATIIARISRCTHSTVPTTVRTNASINLIKEMSILAGDDYPIGIIGRFHVYFMRYLSQMIRAYASPIETQMVPLATVCRRTHKERMRPNNPGSIPKLPITVSLPCSYPQPTGSSNVHLPPKALKDSAMFRSQRITSPLPAMIVHVAPTPNFGAFQTVRNATDDILLTHREIPLSGVRRAGVIAPRPLSVYAKGIV